MTEAHGLDGLKNYATTRAANVAQRKRSPAPSPEEPFKKVCSRSPTDRDPVPIVDDAYFCASPLTYAPGLAGSYESAQIGASWLEPGTYLAATELNTFKGIEFGMGQNMCNYEVDAPGANDVPDLLAWSDSMEDFLSETAWTEGHFHGPA